MSNQTNYQPGHSVHFIQARKALEALGQWKPVRVTEIGLDVITLQERKGTFSYLEEGAALWSPTTDGAWHLFSIDLVTP